MVFKGGSIDLFPVIVEGVVVREDACSDFIVFPLMEESLT